MHSNSSDALTVNTAPSDPTATRRGDGPLGFAIVGLGDFSRNHIVPALEETQFCRLAGIVSGDSEKARRWASDRGLSRSRVYSYDDFARLADHRDIDVVYVAVPTGLHAEFTLRAAAAGKHVFCEAPMATSSRECDRMIAACARADRKLAVSYPLQFEPQHLECVRLAQSREFGSVRTVDAVYGARVASPAGWRLDRTLAGGGALMDRGIYALHAARCIAGEEPVSVTALETTTDSVRFREVEESIHWILEFPSGVTARCGASYASDEQRLRIGAQRGWIELAGAFQHERLEGRTSRGSMLRQPINALAAALDDFARCILEDRESSVDGREGRRDLQIIEAIYRAARVGETVRLTA